ncbi:MAG: hypothetical protein AABX01_02325 [Candidatus Micrarchaeota archaeon]
MPNKIRDVDPHELALKLRRIVGRGIRGRLKDIDGLKIGLARSAPQRHIVINATVGDEFSHSALIPLLTSYLDDVATSHTDGTNLGHILSFHSPLEKRDHERMIYPLTCTLEIRDSISRQRKRRPNERG